ncbi:hypothetical protein QAD02_007465 [Eretmocerus hayati]|uniref:Uncharacterized protein n=1 Tax=Eretmocerus hayati TaxID=131215 RepID=A0ACC2N4B8_9HYME|nr:hypothetical protein QAD02_007465 [Eretmocerus hayati]
MCALSLVFMWDPSYHCKNHEEPSQTAVEEKETTQSGPASETQGFPALPVLPATPTNPAVSQETHAFVAPTAGVKRPHSVSTTSNPGEEDEANGFAACNKARNSSSRRSTRGKNVNIVNPPKKMCSQEEIDTLLEPAESAFSDSPQNHSHSFNDLKSFLKDSYGHDDLLSLAQKYTSDLSVLDAQLNYLYPLVTERKMKSRITKIRSRLTNKCFDPILSSADEDH